MVFSISLQPVKNGFFRSLEQQSILSKETTTSKYNNFKILNRLENPVTLNIIKTKSYR